MDKLRKEVALKLASDDQPAISDDNEYYFVYGQLVRYFCGRKCKELARDTWRDKFDNARVPSAQKETMRRLLADRGDLLALDNVKLKRALAMFYGYAPETLMHKGDVRQYYLYGFTVESVI